MASINKVILIGNLGADPDVRYTPSGKAVATLSVATNKQFKDKETGEKKERVEWHRCVLWDKTAETAGQYLKKGSQVYLEGEKTRTTSSDTPPRSAVTGCRCWAKARAAAVAHRTLPMKMKGSRPPTRRLTPRHRTIPTPTRVGSMILKTTYRSRRTTTCQT